MKVYISGAISGHDKNIARQKFAKAADYLRRQGHEVLNPFDNGLPDSAAWLEHMRADIAMMMSAEAIMMLPCWIESKGAKIELNLAHSLGLHISYFNADATT